MWHPTVATVEFLVPRAVLLPRVSGQIVWFCVTLRQNTSQTLQLIGRQSNQQPTSCQKQKQICCHKQKPIHPQQEVPLLLPTRQIVSCSDGVPVEQGASKQGRDACLSVCLSVCFVHMNKL